MSTLTVGTISEKVTDAGVAVDGVTLKDGGAVFTSAVTATDNTVDLGASSTRFKDLYLSGGAYIGGTGSANFLDDYEEGTFVHSVSNFGGTKNTGFNVGDYTKIGNKVFIHGAIVYASGSVTGTTALFGLPFTIENVNEGHTIISYNGNVASTTINDNRRGSPNQSFFEIGVTSGTGDINLVYHAMYTTA